MLKMGSPVIFFGLNNPLISSPALDTCCVVSGAVVVASGGVGVGADAPGVAVGSGVVGVPPGCAEGGPC